MVSFAAKCVPSPLIMFLNVDNEAVLLNTETEQYYGLDDIGTLFWADLTSAPTIQVALDTLLGKFEDIDETTLRNDIAAFVANMQERGLLLVEG